MIGRGTNVESSGVGNRPDVVDRDTVLLGDTLEFFVEAWGDRQ